MVHYRWDSKGDKTFFLTGITLETKFLGKKLSFFSNKREKFNPRLFLPVKNMEYG